MSADQLAARRDKLRAQQVKDREAVKHLHKRISNRGRHLKTIVKRLRRSRANETVALSAKGAAFLAAQEGEVLTSYNDSAGHCTIGVGHLVSMAPCSRSRTITHEQAVAYLEADAKIAAAAVQADVRVALSQAQRDALISFTFNCGTGALASSTLLKDVNLKASAATIKRDFEMWDIGGPGLLARRDREAALFNDGTY